MEKPSEPALSIEFSDTMKVPELKAAVVVTEGEVKATHPEAVSLLIKLPNAAAFKEEVKQRFGKSQR